jgi:hypothetical protein
MVKPPRIRHSKSRKEPVTIDLEAKDAAASGTPAGEPHPNKAAKPAAAAGATSTTLQAGEPSAVGDRPAAAAEARTGAAKAVPAEGDARPAEQAAPQPGASERQESAQRFGRRERTEEAIASSDAANKPKSAAAPAAAGMKAGESPARRGWGVFPLLAAGAVGGLIVLAGWTFLHSAGVLPAVSPSPVAEEDGPQIAALQSEIEALRQQMAELAAADDPAAADLAEQVESLAAAVRRMEEEPAGESAVAEQTEAVAALTARVDQLHAAIEALPQPAEPGGGPEITAVEERLIRLASEVEQMRTALDDTQRRLATGAEQLAALEARVGALAGQLEEQPRMARAIAAAALRTAIERGEPFLAELETFAATAPDSPAIEQLRAYAAEGVPSHQELVAEAGPAASRIIATNRRVDEDAGLWERLVASAQSLVIVRPTGAIEGTSVPAIAARMEAAIREGDYAQAIAEYEALPELERQAAADFIQSVKARQEVDRLLKEALAGAGNPEAGQVR